MHKSLLKYAPVQIFAAISVFALISIHTKLLKTTEYGMLALMLLTVEVVRAVAAQWINSSMLRLLPSKKEEEYEHFAAIATSIIFCCTLPALVLVILGLYLTDLLTFYTFIATFLLFLTKVFYLFYLELARAMERLNQYRMAVLTQSIMSIVFTGGLLFFYPDTLSALCALFLSYIAAGSIVFKPLKFSISKLRTADAQAVFSYGLPLMVSGLVAAISSRLDRYFIADTLDLAQTGIYSAISNILLGIGALVFMVVALPSYPELAKKINNKTELYKAHGEYLTLLCLVTLPALVGFCLLAEPIMQLLLSEEYLSQDSTIIYILCAGVFVVNLKAHYIDHGLQFPLNTKYLPKISVFSLVVNLTLLITLIPLYGLIGAASAFFITSLFSFSVALFLSIKKGYKYVIPMQVYKIIVSTVCMAIFLPKLRIYNFSETNVAILNVTFDVIIGLFIFLLVLTSLNYKKCKIWISNK